MGPKFKSDTSNGFKDQMQPVPPQSESTPTVVEKVLPGQGSNQGMNGLNFMPALEPNPDNKETLNTTVTSGKGDVETKSSIMELFDSKKQLQRQSLPLRSNVQPEIGATPLRVGGPPHVWGSSMKTAPPSATTGKGSRSGTANGSLGGAERYGYLSFSEVQVEDDEYEDDSEEMGSWGSYSSHADSFRSSREVLQRRLRKRARAWRVFLAVMQDHGLRVRKYHRRGKGWAYRVIKYDSTIPGLRWKSNKWWDGGGGQIPLGDVLDVERRSKVVWIKCLHLGTVGFEASLETDAVIFYLAMDSLLDRRCGVDDSIRERRLTGSMLA